MRNSVAIQVKGTSKKGHDDLYKEGLTLHYQNKLPQSQSHIYVLCSSSLPLKTIDHIYSERDYQLFNNLLCNNLTRSL